MEKALCNYRNLPDGRPCLNEAVKHGRCALHPRRTGGQLKTFAQLRRQWSRTKPDSLGWLRVLSYMAQHYRGQALADDALSGELSRYLRGLA